MSSKKEHAHNINTLAYIVLGMWLTLALCLVL